MSELIASNLIAWELTERRMIQELVLSILLESFVFAPGSKEIYWAMSTLSQPGIAGSTSTYPELPLKISLVDRK